MYLGYPNIDRRRGREKNDVLETTESAACLKRSRSNSSESGEASDSPPLPWEDIRGASSEDDYPDFEDSIDHDALNKEASAIPKPEVVTTLSAPSVYGSIVDTELPSVLVVAQEQCRSEDEVASSVTARSSETVIQYGVSQSPCASGYKDHSCLSTPKPEIGATSSGMLTAPSIDGLGVDIELPSILGAAQDEWRREDEASGVTASNSETVQGNDAVPQSPCVSGCENIDHNDRSSSPPNANSVNVVPDKLPIFCDEILVEFCRLAIPVFSSSLNKSSLHSQEIARAQSAIPKLPIRPTSVGFFSEPRYSLAELEAVVDASTLLVEKIDAALFEQIEAARSNV